MASNVTQALREFRKAPGFALTVIATLALTVALSTTVFSVLDAVFIRPLPYNQPDRIFSMRTISPQGYTQPASYPEFVDWRRDSAAFASLAAYNNYKSVNAEFGGEALALHAVAASDNFFDVFGVAPLKGRTFTRGEEEPGRNSVAVLSFEVWQNLFAAREDVVGTRIKIDGQPYSVVGVMPRGFRFPISQTDAIYMPLNMTWGQRNNRGNHWLPTVARLVPGVTKSDAQRQYSGIFNSLGATYPDTKGRKVQLVDMFTFTTGNTTEPLRLLAFSVIALVAIGCVNLAGLLLARGVRLQHEIAIRGALGAGRWRIISQLLSENVFHALAGGVLGILLAYALLRATNLLLVAALSRGAEVQLNGTVLLASLIVAILTSLLAGSWPAVRLSALSASDWLRSGARGGMDRGQYRVRAAFIAVQVSLALVLLVTSALVFRSLSTLQHTDFGFDPAHILNAEIALSPGSYENRDVVTDFYTPLLERVRAIPRVRAAGLIQLVPIEAWGWNSDIQIVGQPPAPPNEERLGEFRIVTPGYFTAFGIRLIRGRLLDDKLDTPTSQRVMVVNERFVERFIPKGLDPLGQAVMDGDEKVIIVGVVSNIRQAVFRPPLAETDYPMSQIPPKMRSVFVSTMHLMVRTDGRPEAIASDLRTTFAALDKTLPFRTPKSMDDVVAGALTLQRLENWLFGSFAALALVLALIGVYGLISHEVEVSRRDIGIRIAVGATRARIFAQVYRRVGGMLAIGIVGGAAATYAARQLIGTVVAIKPSRDLQMFLGLLAVFVAVALISVFLPARRAAGVDPMESLRSE